MMIRGANDSIVLNVVADLAGLEKQATYKPPEPAAPEQMPMSPSSVQPPPSFDSEEEHKRRTFSRLKDIPLDGTEALDPMVRNIALRRAAETRSNVTVGSLMWLAIHDNMSKQTIDTLLDGKYDVNLPHINFETPLHLCARLGNVDVAQKLLDHSANIEAIGPSSYGPLHYCARYGQPEIAILLIQRGAPVAGNDRAPHSPLYVAARDGHAAVIEVLLDNKADINEYESNLGWTALHAAARYGCKECVATLLRRGAKSDARDNEGYRPLQLAARWGKLDGVQALLDGGVDAKPKTGFLAALGGGWSAKDLALYHGHTTIAAAIQSTEDAKK